MQAEEEVIWKEGVTKHSCPAIRPAHLGPSPAQPEQLLRSDEHCRALQGRGCARLGPPINAGPRLLAPQPGPGGPQLPRRHPIAVCDPYAFLHWRKVWANRQLYWFRSASMRLHSAAYGLSVTSWRRAKGFPSRAAHSKSLRASLSRPCSRAMSELQVFQGSCGRNEHRIRAQHWGPGARPFTTRSHFILENSVGGILSTAPGPGPFRSFLMTACLSFPQRLYSILPPLPVPASLEIGSALCMPFGPL
ncbi:uncharacterized protein LOC120611028 isoform X3 [Pteropus medius]|uniref:uncharacterized protein LOC120611028 isoform X3 n=1 Tax=Pteropus vampyrus TaxID=132908 RepID=UPI00196B5931|nr:uncharacterized protein LOC120611028 isoform X3 [Pteropus giganteus]